MSKTEQLDLKGRSARMAAPTNGIERLLDPKTPIVTKTDLKGRITYANPAFIEISGFTLDELIGQPHNIVRHPDMPRDAFKDLWETTAFPVFGFGGALISFVMAALGLLWLKGRIEHTTNSMLNALLALSEGNFKHDMPASGAREFNKIHTAFKSMQVNLRAIIADVVSSSSEVKSNAETLSQLAISLMTRSQQQSDGINGVASALEELSVSVSEISEATGNSSSHAKKAMDVVDSGSHSMEKSTHATRKVSEVVLDAKMNIEELNRAVLKISTVTHTITEIAEKTNLLALNAAIEAARAGESGRGFAVVADEVRKLAEMTRQSTTEISATVQEVQSGTNKGLETMSKAVDEVNTGTTLILEASESLQAIKVASRGVAQSAKDISAMLEQQSQASLEVANSMERMSSLTESNVAAIKDLDTAAKTLAGTSGNLRVLVKHFEASL